MFQIGAANNSLFFWVLLSKTRHEKICQILQSNSQPTKNINLYHHLMTEFALQKRCQKIFSGAFFPTDPHAHPELYPISLNLKSQSKISKRCVVFCGSSFVFLRQPLMNDGGMIWLNTPPCVPVITSPEMSHLTLWLFPLRVEREVTFQLYWVKKKKRGKSASA